VTKKNSGSRHISTMKIRVSIDLYTTVYIYVSCSAGQLSTRLQEFGLYDSRLGGDRTILINAPVPVKVEGLLLSLSAVL
jgi:hypothetical protein